MNKATRKKWKRANRMRNLYLEPRSAGRYPTALMEWAELHVPYWRLRVVASLALDGLSIKDLP